jgi:hypothetical protein
MITECDYWARHLKAVSERDARTEVSQHSKVKKKAQKKRPYLPPLRRSFIAALKCRVLASSERVYLSCSILATSDKRLAHADLQAKLITQFDKPLTDCGLGYASQFRDLGQAVTVVRRSLHRVQPAQQSSSSRTTVRQIRARADPKYDRLNCARCVSEIDLLGLFSITERIVYSLVIEVSDPLKVTLSWVVVREPDVVNVVANV